MTVRAVLFDLGGVLLPFDRERRVAAIVARTGATADAVRAFMAGDIHRRLDSGEADESDLVAAFAGAFGLPIDAAEASELVLSAFEAPNHELWGFADSLRDRFVVGGFSDNPALVRRMFPPAARLDPLFLSCEMRACKPSVEAFAAVERGLGMGARDILFIDDTRANVDAAIVRGWQAIHFADNAQLMADFAERTRAATPQAALPHPPETSFK